MAGDRAEGTQGVEDVSLLGRPCSGQGTHASALKRILLPPSDSPIFFCDVILADILTSFAKVLGDLWISSCQIWNGGITLGRKSQSGWAHYITLVMVWYVPLFPSYAQR